MLPKGEGEKGLTTRAVVSESASTTSMLRIGHLLRTERKKEARRKGKKNQKPGERSNGDEVGGWRCSEVEAAQASYAPLHDPMHVCLFMNGYLWRSMYVSAGLVIHRFPETKEN